MTAHIHVSYDRRVGDVRLLSPGSVGRPYEGERGARWALLGPDVELRRTEYDHERTCRSSTRERHPAASRTTFGTCSSRSGETR